MLYQNTRECVKSHYRCIFLEAIDAIKMATLSWFDQDDYRLCFTTESVLVICYDSKNNSDDELVQNSVEMNFAT